MGYPVVHASIKSSTDDAVELELSQSWFLADGSSVSTEEQKTWTLPILAASASHRDGNVELCSNSSFTFTVKCGKNDWIKLNYGHPVLMRVCYSPELLERLHTGIA